MSHDFTRRELLKNGSMLAIGLAAPAWLSSIARADVIKRGMGKNIDPDGVLVVIQLSGGNDGLNTVVPWADANYYKLRPTLGHAADKVLKLNESMGLHPVMTGFETLYKEGKVAIIQGVGYPQANRSHFKSMDIWHQASPDTSLSRGWIGRHLDHVDPAKLNPVYALGLSNDKPRALDSEKVSVPCFASLADIQAMVGDLESEQMLRDISSGAVNADQKVIQAANKSALDAMVELRDRLAKFAPKETYGDSSFGSGLKQVAQLIATSPNTRVVYLSAGGFDTHAKQLPDQEKLLGGFSAAILAFQRELEAIGKADKVTVMVFSEFGRRSYENASGGTDHGAAAPMFMIGKNVKGGMYGKNPNLTDLADGDIKFGIDFRQVYATALDQWMGGDSGVTLGGKFDHIPLLKV